MSQTYRSQSEPNPLSPGERKLAQRQGWATLTASAVGQELLGRHLDGDRGNAKPSLFEAIRIERSSQLVEQLPGVPDRGFFAELCVTSKSAGTDDLDKSAP